MIENTTASETPPGGAEEVGISDECTIDVEIRPRIGAARGKEVTVARKAVEELTERQRTVAVLSRRDLESDLSGADIAVVLDVSPQRVSQLLNA